MEKLFLMSVCLLLLLGCGGKKDHKTYPEQLGPIEENTPSPLPAPIRTETEVVLGELTCTDKGGHITNCHLEDKVLAEKQSALTKFTLAYNFACIGDSLSIVVAIDGIETALKQESDVTLTLYGFGSVVLKTSDREVTKGAYVQPGCKLEVTDVKLEAA